MEFLKKNIVFSTILSFWILSLIESNTVFAQVEKPFTQRTSTHALPEYIKPNTNGKIYNLRGDFQMIGNTNLTLEDYNDATGNGDENMKYVDIDNDGTTINSSSAYLNLPDDGCTEIVYAGLYWSGRASTGSMSFNVEGTAQGNPVYNTTTQTLNHTHNGTNNLDDTTVVININNTNENDVYPVQLVRIGNKVFEFTIRNNGTVYKRERIGIGEWTELVPISTTVNDYSVQTTTTTYNNVSTSSVSSGILRENVLQTETSTVTSWQGMLGYKEYILTNPITYTYYGNTYTISKLRNHYIYGRKRTATATRTRNSTNWGFSWSEWSGYSYGTWSAFSEYRHDGSLSDFRNATNNFTTIRGPKTTVTTTNVSYNGTLTKNKIKLKKGNGAYQTFTANTSDIHYPNGSYSDIYAAYVDVTEYVRNNGLGNYFVADLATSTGNGGGTGYFGGWGMVVVYANPNMKWRDVTIFDGYAHVAVGNQSSASHDINISGFQAAQKGDVNISVGVIAGEGDVDINGDYLSIERRNTTNFENLGNSGGTGGAFFRSAVETGGNVRVPELVNNTGIDIQRIEIPNQQINNQNYIIANNQTSTTFRYGSDQDTYVINTLVFAVDAYVPNAQNANSVLSIINEVTNESFEPDDAGFENRLINLQPHDQVTLQSGLYNYGGVDNERVVGPFLPGSTTQRDRVQLNVNLPSSTFLKSAEFELNTNGIADIVSTDPLENNNAQTHFGQFVWISADGTETIQPNANVLSINNSDKIGGRLVWRPKDIPRQDEESLTRNPMATLTYVIQVIDDCVVLLSSEDNCILDTSVSGGNIGFGENSGSLMKDGFLIGYSDPGCGPRVPIYGKTELFVKPIPSFFEECDALQTGSEILLEHICEAPTSYSWNYIANMYPEGTRFYTIKPSEPNYTSSILTPNQVITLQFEPTTEDGIEEDWIYAMLPGVTNTSCYFNVHIVLKSIYTHPEVDEELKICANVPYEWPLTLSEVGQENNFGIQVFAENNDFGADLFLNPPIQTVSGIKTYYTREVSYGSNNEILCKGPLQPFTINVEGCHIIFNPMIQTPLNRN